TTAINYFCTLQIVKARDGEEEKGERLRLKSERKAKFWKWVAFLSSLGILCYFKYSNFFISSVNDALSLLGIAPKLELLRVVLPIGISFFTFQALTYTLDVYNKKTEVRRNFIDVALFVSFFPTILSGPIEKARNFLPQLEGESRIIFTDIIEGGKRFIWGLFKKMVIADRLAAYIGEVYFFEPSYHSGITLIVTAVFYSFQVYADFSGYSDMAIGIGRALGFKLTENFKYPYFSTSVKEYWRRWHVTLSSWLTEYIYFPMGGNRVKTSRWLFNIIVVFLLSGLWHGDKWSYIFWGGLNGIYYLAEFYYKKTSFYEKLHNNNAFQKINPFLSMVVVFALVTIARVFFRTEDVGKAFQVLSGFFTNEGGFYWRGSAFETAVSMALLVLFIGLDFIRYKEYRFHPLISYGGYAVLICILLLFGVSESGFVYFRF
ncbi:MBOAT family protein, partial [Bacteroidales bacterium OttesenSCG-928-A17]|nr:MBOAT family protein [Bacteroidales bacterium OttesenSCG-928-A17]